jgi:hypothetical protein
METLAVITGCALAEQPNRPWERKSVTIRLPQSDVLQARLAAALSFVSANSVSARKSLN